MSAGGGRRRRERFSFNFSLAADENTELHFKEERNPENLCV